MPIKKFKVIEANLPEISFAELSTDQQYLYKICNAISKGKVSLSLSHRDPGKMAHARWITTANRILRLYVATETPSESLLILSQYVIKVYALLWFEIRSQPSCKNGSKHFFGMIKMSRFLPDNLQKIIDPVLQRNGYFGHPENILLAMLADNRKEIRELGLRRLLKCRQTKKKQPSESSRYLLLTSVLKTILI